MIHSQITKFILILVTFLLCKVLQVNERVVALCASRKAPPRLATRPIWLKVQ